MASRGFIIATGVSLALFVAAAVAQDAPKPPPRPAEFAPESHGSAIDLDIPNPPPLPPRRPDDLPAPVTSSAPVPPVEAPPAVAAPPAQPRVASEKDLAVCKQLLESGDVTAHAVPAINGPGECGIDAPVMLEGIVLSDKRVIRLEPPTTIRCDLAAALARWVSLDVVPGLAAQGATLEKITDADAYSCRSRNHVFGAKLSEHARGNAIDLAALVMSAGKPISLTGPEIAPYAASLRESACARFTTILGPGSDGYHNNHIHLDLEDRRTHGTLCQWNLSPAGPPAQPGPTVQP